MSRIEDKLIELGYEPIGYNGITDEYEYIKFMPTAHLTIYYCRWSKTYYGICQSKKRKSNQIVIEKSPEAQAQLKKDLEELEEC